MRLPWRRVAPAPVAQRPAAGPAAESRAGWAFLPPLQRTVGAPELTSRPMEFVASLSTRAQPMLTGSMSHVVSPAAPSGVLDCDGGRLGTPTARSSDVDLALVAPAPPRPVHLPVQRRTGVLLGLDAPPKEVPELQAVPVEPATTPDGPVDTPAATTLGPLLPTADPVPPGAPAGTAVQHSPTPGPPADLPHSAGDATFVALPPPPSVDAPSHRPSPLTRPAANPAPVPVVQRRTGLGPPLRPGRSAVATERAPSPVRHPAPDEARTSRHAPVAAPSPTTATPVERTIAPPEVSAAIASVPPRARTAPGPAVTPDPSAPAPTAVVPRHTSDDPPDGGARSLGDDTSLPQVARAVVPADDGGRATPATPSVVTTTPVVARTVAGLPPGTHASGATTPPTSGHADRPSAAGAPARVPAAPSASSSRPAPAPDTPSVPRTAGNPGGPAPATATSGVAASAPGRSSVAGTPSPRVQRSQAPVIPTPVEGPPPPGNADTAPPVQPAPTAAVPLLPLPLPVPPPNDSPPASNVVQRAPLLSVARRLGRVTPTQAPTTLGVVPGRPPAAVPTRAVLDVPVVPTRPAPAAPDLAPVVQRTAHVPPTVHGGPGRASPPSAATVAATSEPTPGRLAVRPAPVRRVDAPARALEPARTAQRAVQDVPPQDPPARSTVTVQTLAEPPTVPTATPPETVAAPHAGGASPFASASAADLDELARRLTAPLLRRVRGQLLVDRERRGVRADL